MKLCVLHVFIFICTTQYQVETLLLMVGTALTDKVKRAGIRRNIEEYRGILAYLTNIPDSRAYFVLLNSHMLVLK